MKPDPEVDSGLFVRNACFDSGYMYCVSVLGQTEGFPFFLRGVIRLLKSILVLLSWLVVSRDSAASLNGEVCTIDASVALFTGNLDIIS